MIQDENLKKNENTQEVAAEEKPIDPAPIKGLGDLGVDSLPVTSYWQDVVRLFLKNKVAVIGLIMMVIIIFMCCAAPLFTKYDPVADIEFYNVQQHPGGDHFLGTDHIGRDVWARLLYGGRTSVLTGVLVALFAGAIGVTVGLVAGYYGGTIDSLMMRFTDIMLSFPFLILAIAIMAALGSSQRNIIISLAITSWPGFARLTRSQVLSIRHTEYVEAAKVAGFSDARIIFRHVLPNCMGTIIIQLTLSIGGAILSAAGLAYLGMSPNVAKPEWGAMLNDGKPYLRTHSYLTTIPGVAISITVLAINWIGDGLRDAFDPKMRK